MSWSKIMKYSIFFYILILFFINCNQNEPGVKEIVKVKQGLVLLRFNAPFMPELMKLNDMELFIVACNSLRVSSKKMLELIKKEDPIFYKKLNEN